MIDLGRRRRAADHVFERLAAAIFAGDLLPGAHLPAERVFAEQFGVSPIIVRQAVHRLAELGLVQTRQGSPTLVNDPAHAQDLQVVELSYLLGPHSEDDVRDLAEVQVMRGLGLVQVAELHASDAELQRPIAIVEEYALERRPDQVLTTFERRFWGTLAEIGKNRFYRVETAWWYRLLDRQPLIQHPILGPAEQRILFYRELARRLAARENAARFYLDIVTPVLSALHEQTRATRSTTRSHHPRKDPNR